MGFTVNQERTAVKDRAAALLLPPLLVLFVAAVLVFRVVYTTITVDGASMDPTLKDWDYLLVTRSYDVPARGDVVSIEAPDPADEPIVKRVIGIPGDTVELHGDQAYVNGAPEQWPAAYGSTDGVSGPVVVPEGRVWVMGDNRANSFDSRRFGSVPLEKVRGRALAVYWPPQHMRRLDSRTRRN